MWTWNENLIVGKYDSNKYTVEKDRVIIFYPRFVDVDNPNFHNVNEAICYLHLIKNPPGFKSDIYATSSRRICDFCWGYNNVYSYVFKGCYINRCRSCYAYKNNAGHFISKIQNNAIKHSIETTIDITYIQDKNVIFLYHCSIDKLLFDFKDMLTKPSCFSIGRIGVCCYCKRNVIYHNFACKSCYEYSYYLSGLQKITMLEYVIDFDILSHILCYYSRIMKIDMTSEAILSIRNQRKKKNINRYW